ncbi:MAG: DNA-protecting protein DprA [Acidobacteria bacterium]|nr:DNA-protecting protein DprA [Acidobacteriota bacterium]
MAPSALPRDAAWFPRRLQQIPDAPASLWYEGDPSRLPAPARPSLAVVGTRAATRDALEQTREVADRLARLGVVIVSGLARGIDAVAHRAALDAGGVTIAVLGSGLDCLYPPEHRELATRIAATGAVLSEYPPDTPPRLWMFPRRNRLVAGLADAVLVVEAPERSGALITAGAAGDQGKEVFVMPGRCAGGRNRGGHLLIRDGARLVEGVDDIVADAGWQLGTLWPGKDAPGEAAEFSLDEYTRTSGLTVSEALARLLELELAGEVTRVGASRFRTRAGRMLT